MKGEKQMKKVLMGAALACAAYGCASLSQSGHTDNYGENLREAQKFVRSGIENSSQDSMVLSDDNFEYDFSRKEGVCFKVKNEDATIVDLNNFIWSVCWNGYLRERSEKLSNEDACLLGFCVNAQCHVANELAVTALIDILGEEYIERLYKRRSTEFAKLKENFQKSDVSIRQPMREWAKIYSGIDHEIVIEILRYINDGSEGMKMDEYSRIVSGMTNITARGTEIGEKWRGFVGVLSPYLEEMRKVCNFFEKVRYERIDDSYTKAAYEKIRSESINRYISTMRMFNIMLYDLPFCLETYRAYGKLKNCKWAKKYLYVADDDEKMKNVLRDYSQAISVTDMLVGISTPHAASCYSELIKFFKDEQWERRFKDFVNESKLYKLTTETANDGKQNNKLEKW